MYKVPKAIASHPAVAWCMDAQENGSGPEYRHEVCLKSGWTWGAGRNEGGTGLFVNSVAEFRAANPVRESV